MKWKPGKRNPNLEDRRGQSPPSGGGGLGGGSASGFPIPLPGGKSGGGIGTILIIIVLFLVIRGCGGGDGGGGSGFDIPGLPGDQSQVPAQPETGGDSSLPEGADPEANQVEFVNFVLTDLDAFWTEQFQGTQNQLQTPGLVVFRQGVNTGCGQASSATGPFYCPLDQKAYVDLSFFNELSKRFGAPGDFAQAYVLAHEYGHHIQQQLGIEEKVRAESQNNPDEANELSVRLELQADCFAGLWGKSAFDAGILEDGDLDEGITAAEAVGDDRIQEQAGGRINPESFTHGTSEQRSTWFRKGFDSGDIQQCDTFSGDDV